MSNAVEQNSVIGKLAEILDAFGDAPQRFTFTDIAERTQLSKASVHRLMGQLVDLRFLEKAGTGKTYKLGERLTRLLHFNLDTDVLKSVLTPVLQEVADTLSEAAFMARLCGTEVELFAVQGPRGENKSFIHPGIGIRPVHACSSAKCILAHQSNDLLSQLLEKNLPKFTDATLVEREAIVTHLEEIRRDGFAVCDEEIDEGVYSIACPVFLESTGVIYSVGVVAPKGRISDARLGHIRTVLADASTDLSALLREKTGSRRIDRIAANAR
jgi:DNA-binding IclR family transcriptional regulator